MFIHSVTTDFPYQKRSTREKGKKFCSECLEGALNLAYVYNEGLRQTKENMIVNYNLANDILDPREVEKITNPWNLKGATFPAKMQNYPLLNPKIDLLVGEEFRRRFDWQVVVVNDDAVSEKEKFIKDQIMQGLLESALDQSATQEQIEAKVKELDKWRKYEAQDMRERRATQYLQYLWKEQNLKLKFNKGFYDALIAGEEIYCVDVVAGEPEVRKCDPQTITVIGIGTSHYIEDADIIIEDTYQPLGWVIDHYYDHLKSSDIDDLERGISGQKTPGNMSYNNLRGPENPFVISNATLSTNGALDVTQIDINDYLRVENTAAFDSEGNVRVVRVVWKSRRKVGDLKYYDEDGNLQVVTVDENYKPNIENGEKVEWYWINEYWECTRLAQDKYVKYGPRPVQFRRMGNKSMGGSGYVGTIYAINSSRAMSLMDRGKAYQYLYNVFMYRTELAFARAKGKIGVMDLSMIPDDWDMDQWLYYAEVMGWAAKDPFNAGKEGVATGKLAGNMNQNNAYIDLELGSYIQQHISMLQFIEMQLGQIVGITKEREGQIENRQTVGGVERSVAQSNHITEKWFFLHDDTKKRVLEVLLETAKYAWRNTSSKRVQYISDELTSQIAIIDGEQFNEADYGLMITDSSDVQQLISDIKSLAQAGIQNDKINFSTLMSIYFSESVSSMRRKIEQSEEDAIERQQQQLQQQIESNERMAQGQNELEMAKLELEDKLNLRDNETKILISQLGQQGENGNEDESKIELERTKLLKSWREFEAKHNLDKKKLDETIRHNKASEQISKIKSTQKPKNTK